MLRLIRLHVNHVVRTLVLSRCHLGPVLKVSYCHISFLNEVLRDYRLG